MQRDERDQDPEAKVSRDEVGSLQPGRLADIVLWKPEYFGAKPFLVLKSDSVKPLSVYLQSMANVDKGTLMAALAISTLIPIVMFLVFQRMFLRGAGLGGAVKG